MNNWRKITACLLLLGMCLTLTGCGAFQRQMTKTVTGMAKLKTFHTDAEAYLGAVVNVGGQKIRMEATVTGGFDTETDPMLLKTDLQLETMGVARDLRLYVWRENGVWQFRPWEEGAPENTLTEAEKREARKRTLEALKLLIRCGDCFAEPVDDLVGGMHTRRYDGVLPDQILDEAMLLLNGAEKDAGEDSAAQAAEIITENAAETDEDGADTAPEAEAETENPESGTLSGLPVSIWISDDNRIVQADIDLARFLQAPLEQALALLLTDYDLDDLDMETELQYADTRLTFSRFDESEPLRPQAS